MMNNTKEKIHIWSSIKKYRWKSVFLRYFLSFFVLILITLIPYNVLLYKAHQYNLSSEVSKYSTANALKSKSIFDILTSSFDLDYQLASDASYVNEFLMAESTLTQENSISLSQNMVQSMVENADFIDEVFIYSFANKHYIYSGGLRKTSEKNTEPWLKTYKATKFPFVMFPRKVDSEEFNYLFICSEMYDENNQVIGIFSARIRYEDFTNVVRQSFQDEPDKIFIVSDIGLILYSDDKTLINTLVFEREDIYAAFQSAELLEGNTITFEDYIISVAKSSSNNLMLMSYFSNDFLMENYSYLTQLMMICMICVFLLAVIIALYISLKQYRAVTQVMQTFDHPEKFSENQDELLSEFFYISNTISNIARKNQTINDELAKKMMLLKKVQIEALQAQINPHFLFNTLQLINLSIIKEVKGDTTSTYLVSQLAQLLRTSYDTEHYIVTFEQEYMNLQRYLAIQKIRYKNRLTVVEEIEEDCFWYKTLNLLLQPFVENAIVHGFEGKTSDWQIQIRCYQSEDNLCYEISDNGRGMEAEKVEAINHQMSTLTNSANGSIGIANVNQRLRLLYGTKCSVSFTSEYGNGTKVVIKHEINQQL